MLAILWVEVEPSNPTVPLTFLKTVP